MPPHPSSPALGDTAADARPLRVYIVAGEPSGDQLGALLMKALVRQSPGREIRFAGVGGERMAAEGLTSAVPMEDLAVMGLMEVLPRVRRIMAHLKTVQADIAAFRPDVVITIDSWGFTGRLHKALKAARDPALRIHYVAPMVWIWKEGRAASVAAVVDHLLVLWPFEPPYFLRHNLPTTHVGHAVIETGLGDGDAGAFRLRHGIGADAPVLVVLPGSRKGEIRSLLGIFGETVRLLAEHHPDLRVVIPAPEHLRERIARAVDDWPGDPVVVTGATEKAGAFATARAALAASGTVSLELALARVPHVVAYRVHPATAFLLRRLLSGGARFVNMINVLVEREVIPEMLQEKANPRDLYASILDLLENDAVRTAQVTGMDEALAHLAGPGTGLPSEAAARVILQLAGTGDTTE
ncbi:lipid-A-disaccharide synthase [Phaeovibrio sulfidiphilus]|uniref:Lipid-A-disaccharide synthase n=1 Tax=Phaeovibrio sulfidiphilus TaxID=1220600 RepID=A0A8J6YP07_9PROT|nr:lipid-A-disaccharide synthase [Phaeovibrio sulfidiphilus]MBE1236911.1 lipid-A-disaccharide synthase [Phaeovibrio sulfidiphilus]